MSAAVLRQMAHCPAFRISPQDSNYFALVFDSRSHDCGLVAVVEIFEPGGATPPNVHRRAHEMFFVLEGEGIAYTGGDAQPQPLRRGDALLVRPGTEHLVRNTGAGKLYCLTVMVPDEECGDLIRAGTPAELDEEDRRVLGQGG
jgi:mannose-6-phosphate isomerase-like protein (cupin superfamily)